MKISKVQRKCYKVEDINGARELTVQQGRRRSVVMTGLRLMQRVALSRRVCAHLGLE